MRRTLRRLLLAMLLGVLLYGGFVLYAGYQQIRDSLSGFRWSAFAGALGLACFNYLLRFAKWEFYLAKLDIRGVPKLDSLLIFLSGFVLTITPGKVGEVFKSAVLMETHDVPMARTAPIIIAERLTDVIGVVSLIVIGSLGFSGGLGWAAAGAIAVCVGLVLILWKRPGELFLGKLESGSPRRQALAAKLREALSSLRVLASPAALPLPTLLSIVGWGAEGTALYLLLGGFGVTAPLTTSVFFYATATLAGALIPVPGGLGVTEALIQEQLVHLAAVPQGTATSAMLLIRFATLWWAVIVGFVALGLLRGRYPGLMADRGHDQELKRPT